MGLCLGNDVVGEQGVEGKGKARKKSPFCAWFNGVESEPIRFGVDGKR